MTSLVERLEKKAQRGSKPRCHYLTHGPRDAVAARIAALTVPTGSNEPFSDVTVNDAWMPQGFDVIEEAQLHKATRLIDGSVAEALRAWWLPHGRASSRSPNLDIASTCNIEGRRGLILVEAKAHGRELEGEARAKPLADKASQGSKINHESIGAAIKEACQGLHAATGLDWHIGRDNHYQMSNRFAWGWKLAQLGVPVVLVYLGFVGARDMTRGTEMPFEDAAAWDAAVRRHSAPLFPNCVWNTKLRVNDVPFVPIIKSVELPLQEIVTA